MFSYIRIVYKCRYIFIRTRVKPSRLPIHFYYLFHFSVLAVLHKLLFLHLITTLFITEAKFKEENKRSTDIDLFFLNKSVMNAASTFTTETYRLVLRLVGQAIL